MPYGVRVANAIEVKVHHKMAFTYASVGIGNAYWLKKTDGYRNDRAKEKQCLLTLPH